MLKFNSSNKIFSLDPAHASTQDNIWAVSQIFNGLIELDDQLLPIPAIAKSWEISPDGLSYVFNLRTDVRFHSEDYYSDESGRTLIAEDFVYSFNRIIDPETASPGAWIFNNKLAETDPFVAKNDSTFIIKLREPYGPMLSMLSMPYCFAVPKEVVEAKGTEFGRSPIGTGPFRFKQWEDDVKLILSKNKHYFEDGLPHLDALSISFIKSKETAFLEFIQGKLDFFNGIESSFKDEIIDQNGVLNPKLADDFQMIKGPFLNTEYLAFYLEESGRGDGDQVFLDQEFRKALNLAIDRKKMIRFLRNDVGDACDGGFIPKGLPGYEKLADSVYAYNPEAAKKALVRSSYDGVSPIKISTTKDYLDLCIFVQSQWREIGVNVEIDVIPASILKNQKRHGELAFFRASWIADYADAENYLSCFYSPNHSPDGPNYTHFKSAQFDSLYKRSLKITSDSLKYEAYAQMDRLLMSEYPIVPLFYDESVWLASKRVQNLRLNPLKIPKFKWVKIMK